MGIHILNGLTGIKVFDSSLGVSPENLDLTEDTGASPTGVPDDETTVCFIRVKVTDNAVNLRIRLVPPNVDFEYGVSAETLRFNGQNKIGYLRPLTSATGTISWWAAGATNCEVWVLAYIDGLNESGKDDLQWSKDQTMGSGKENFTAENEAGTVKPLAWFFYNAYLQNTEDTPTNISSALIDLDDDVGSYVNQIYGGLDVSRITNTGDVKKTGTLSAISKASTADIGVEWYMAGSGGESTNSHWRMYMQAWTDDLVTVYNTEIFDATVASADTFEDLDPSGTIGEGYHYVRLRVRMTGSTVVTVRPKGGDSSIGGEIDYGAHCCQIGSAGVAALECITNSDGLLEISASNNTETITVDVIAAIDAVVAPTVTTQAATVVLVTSATGNGNITDGGEASITQHGVCWKAGADPVDIAGADGYTEEGVGAEGAFTSTITPLIEVTEIYYRAYATNAEGTSYGAAQSFTTKLRPRII